MEGKSKEVSGLICLKTPFSHNNRIMKKGFPKVDKVSGKQLRITFKIIRACIFLTLIGGMLAGVCFTSVLLAAKWQGPLRPGSSVYDSLCK